MPSIALLKTLLFCLCLAPLGRLGWAAWSNDFGPNPVEFIERWTGTWTINFLWLTLAITPLRVHFGLPWLGRLRRMLGLFTFFYASLHLLAFIGFDHDFSLDAIARDIFKRPFVTVGFAAFVLLVPLALTSNAFAIRRLGGRGWQNLHRAIYPISLLALCHYLWLVKITAILWPLAYGAVLAVLLGWRVIDRQRRARQFGSPQRPAPGSTHTLRFFSKRPPSAGPQ